MSSYQEERDHVTRLLEPLAIIPDRLVDPKLESREETGVDVIAWIGGRKIDIQVTEYNPDFGLPKRPPKQSRAKEKLAASENSWGYGFSVSGQYIDALRKSISNKLTKGQARAQQIRTSFGDRPAPAGWVALRLLADVDISFWRNYCSQIRGRRWSSGDRRRC